jgi:hypothetical protein
MALLSIVYATLAAEAMQPNLESGFHFEEYAGKIPGEDIQI